LEKIYMIPVEWLAHHPDNPRKDLGDLTELAESIRANGILQNLTIVAAEEDTEEDGTYKRFWVVIGNRRLEAAKMAGLTEVPCVLVEMDRKAQVATMLEENMQRADLTAYEQAEGFQMMMDLGFTQKEVSEKTGFSEKTVRDRLKLTKLNKKNFSDAVVRGATIMDLIEITKLDSKTDQNKVLEYAGTENFRKEMLDALEAQEFRKNKSRLQPVVAEYMEELPENERYNSKWERESNDFKLSGTEEELRKHINKVMNQHKNVPWRYDIWKYQGGKIEFFHGKEKKEAEQVPEGELTERQKAIRRGKHLRYVKSFWEKAYELRKDFVMNYTVANGQSASTIGKIMVRYALSNQISWTGEIGKSHDWSDKLIREMLKLPPEPVEVENREDPDEDEYLTVWQQVDGKSDTPLVRIMMVWAVAGGVFWPDAPEHGLYNYNDGHYYEGSYQANGVVELYDFLVDCGYQMSDMEKQLLDGTHPCYQEDAGV